MTPVDMHQRSQDVFARVLAAVGPDQLEAPSPCAGWDVRAVVDHVISGNERVQLLAGREPPALPDDPGVGFAASAEGAQSVFAAADGLTRSFETHFGPVPGASFIFLRTTDVLTHAWDLAKATGQPTDLDPELAAIALAGAKERIRPDFRGEGRPFAEEQPCPEGRCPADQLAAFLGRTVD